MTLNDGRIVLAAHDRVVVEDGVEWEIYYSPRGVTLNNDLIEDSDGAIYSGVPGGAARIEFNPAGQWNLQSVLTLPEKDGWNSMPVIGATKLNSEWLWDSGSGPVLFLAAGPIAQIDHGDDFSTGCLRT